MLGWLLGSNKKKHKDEVQAFEYNGKLFPTLHAMNCQKERDGKREAVSHLKNVLYYLSIDKIELARYDEYEQEGVVHQIERNYVFRGEEHDIQKLADLLIEHWPYLGGKMNEYQIARRKREAEENDFNTVTGERRPKVAL